MESTDLLNRRDFLRLAGAAGAGALFATAAPAAEQEKPISPPEDLMHEHGALRRILLIYRHYLERLGAGAALDLGPLHSAAQLIRSFVEGYHEKLEEEHLFPRFRKADREVELVNLLRVQHEAGRRVTARVLAATATPAGATDGLRVDLAAFVRMYEPHAAREDTVVFTEFSDLLTERQLRSLGELFEKRETQLFGEHGFEKIVDQVAALEKTLGLYDLAQYTPAS